MTNFSIIGGGLSGISAVGQLVNRLKQSSQKGKIIIYEKNADNLATGMPFNSKNPDIWLLNGPPASKFRLLPDGETLEEWMAKHRMEKDEFPSRKIVGEYLKSEYKKIKEDAERNGIEIEEKFEEVIDIETEGDSFKIITEKNASQTDAVMLCFGHLPSDTFQHLRNTNNYIHSPWDTEKLKQLPKDATIHFIGQHLTFIDVVKFLCIENNFQGEMVALTRTPSIITMRSPTVSMPDEGKALSELGRELSTQENLSFDKFQSLFWKAYSNSAKLTSPIDPKKLSETHDARKIINYQLGNQKMEEGPYLGDINVLRTFIERFYFEGAYDAAWKALPEEQREIFNKCFYSILLGILVGIPTPSAVVLNELYSASRIKEFSNLTSVEYNKEEENFTLKFEDGSTQIASHLINCTGPGRDITKHFDTHPLLATLSEKGLIKPIKSGGIATDDANHVLNKKNEVVKNLYAIGPTVYHGKKPSPYAVYFSCWGVESAVKDMLPQENITASPGKCF